MPPVVTTLGMILEEAVLMDVALWADVAEASTPVGEEGQDEVLEVVLDAEAVDAEVAEVIAAVEVDNLFAVG